WARSAARERFDAARGPLWGVRVRTGGPDGQAVLVAADRLAADEAALSTMLADLGRLYTAEVTGEPADLPPVTGFGALARAEHERLADPAARDGRLAALA